MSGTAALRDAPHTEFFSRFARPVIPSGVARFPNTNSRCHLRRHGRINPERAAHRHFGKGVFGLATVAIQTSFGDRDVSVYAHVRLLLLALVCFIVRCAASILSRFVRRDATRDTFRDAPGHSGRGTHCCSRDIWGGDIPPYRGGCPPCPGGSVCPGGTCPGARPMNVAGAVAVLALGTVAAGALGFALGYAWGWLWW